MTSNFGLDLSSLYDVDDTRTVTGVRLVAEDTYWRLVTPLAMGVLEADAPEYGLDLEGMIGAVDSPAQAASLPNKIETGLALDPRIGDVTVQVVRNLPPSGAVTYAITIRCETAEGDFELVGLAGAEGLHLDVKLLPGGI
jgi:hypothetical protein